jgi:glycosyltransferase involved in cell wall biosynthesis
MPDRSALHGPAGAPVIAYIVKGYPRLSELFIASEIHRLEQIGFRLRLFVIKPGDNALRHPTVDRIRAAPEYLPETAPVSGIALWRWLLRHLPRFAAPLARTARRWPLGVARAACAAGAQALRARSGVWSAPRKVYLKEFLQAVAIADRLRDTVDVRHLHAHFCHGATTVAWLAAMISGRTFSFTAHAKDLYTPSLNPGGLLRRKLGAAQFAVTCTEANRRFLLEQAGTTPVVRVYHGLNAEFAGLLARHAAHGERPAQAHRLRIVSVGRHVHKKGFDLLVAACAQLARRGVPMDATIIGERGDDTDAIAAAIRDHGLQQCVTLLDPMSQSDLLAALRTASGIPNVLVEAMAAGLPVVTTNVSGIPELVEDGDTGLVVEPDHATAIADALQRLDRDAALRRRLGAAGRHVVAERFDGDRLIGELAALFRRVA